jgi:hypothetical protein
MNDECLLFLGRQQAGRQAGDGDRGRELKAREHSAALPPSVQHGAGRRRQAASQPADKRLRKLEGWRGTVSMSGCPKGAFSEHILLSCGNTYDTDAVTGKETSGNRYRLMWLSCASVPYRH